MSSENTNNEARIGLSLLNAELERRFWVWWKESGWKGNSDADAALEAWMESAKAEREACAKVCDALRDEWARLKVGAKDGRYEMMEEAASVCEDEILKHSNT